MRYEDDPPSGGMPDCDLPFLSAGVVWIGECERQRVKEYGRRLVKGHTVFLNVGLRFRRTPFEDHRHSLSYRYRCQQ